MAVAINSVSTLFQDVTPCRLVEVYRRLGAINCLRFQGRNKLAAHLLGLIFYPKNGIVGPAFHRNFSILLPYYMASHPEDSDLIPADFPDAQHVQHFTCSDGQILPAMRSMS
jgi:hypothetical protein